MSFPRHAKYMDSGSECLREVPTHWALTCIKRFATLQRGHDLTDAERTEGDHPVITSGGRSGTHGTYMVNGPGVVTGRYGSTGRLFFVEENYWPHNTTLYVSDFHGNNPRFVWYSLQTVDFGAYSAKSAVPGIDRNDIHPLPVVVPTKGEQREIVNFLDCETAKIDALVEDQRRLIDLLKEKRHAVISHALTKGLDPRVPTRDSGVEWLGLIPKHWDSGTLTRVADRVVVGIAEAATHAYADEGVAILRSTNIRAGKIIGEILYVTPEFAEGRATKLINAGDLVTVRTGNAGVTAVVPESLDGCQCFTMLITSLSKLGVSAFYCYALNSLPSQRYFSLEGWGTAQVNISVPILKALPVVIPPLIEQRAIVEYLDSATAKLDALVAEAESAMRLLGERRSALISAAVTGKIDVRGLVPQAEAVAA